jgi:hypothetical protein
MPGGRSTSSAASHLVAPAASSAGVRLQSPAEASLLASMRAGGGADSSGGTPRAGGGGGPFGGSLAAAARARAAKAAAALRSKDWAGDSRSALAATVAASKEAAGAVASLSKAAANAAEERLRRLRMEGGGGGGGAPGGAAPSSATPGAALAALCASEASAVPCPRALLVCLAGLVAAAEAGGEVGGAFVVDAPAELASFVLAEAEASAGVALPPPGATPLTLASAAKLYLASLPEPTISPPAVLADFIGAGAAAAAGAADEGGGGAGGGGAGAAAAAAASRAAAALPPSHATVLTLVLDAAGRLVGCGADPWVLGTALAPALAWHATTPLSDDEAAAVGRAVGCLILRAAEGGGGATSPHAL